MGEIKSRWEIISEKLKEMPAMSPQELRETEEAEYAPIGRTLADKYLEHGYGELLEEEVDKYQGKDIVIKAALSRLVEAIGLGIVDLPMSVFGRHWAISSLLHFSEAAGRLGAVLGLVYEEYKR